MKTDVIVIGSGMGGLACAAALARRGKKVLLLEKEHHIGGTSFCFRRGPFLFPMGPLAFSFPGQVGRLLADMGVEDLRRYTRSHFQLLSPSMDIILSQPWGRLERELASSFSSEAPGLKIVFARLGEIMAGLEEFGAKQHMFPAAGGDAAMPSAAFLRRHLSNPTLVNFLGSLGTTEPEMSLLTLARMWAIMSETGIWFPSGGIHAVAGDLHRAFLTAGGELRMGTGVAEIVVKKGRAAGVITESGEVLCSEWVVSNADYKKTFLQLLAPRHIPSGHLAKVRSLPYTESGLCLSLGVDSSRIDLSAMRAEHLFFRKNMSVPPAENPEDFSKREIEICLWSRSLPEAAPPGKAALVLRVSFPYGHFAAWRVGERRRLDGYSGFKAALAKNLIRVAETVLPGLESAVEVMDIATPLTYRDWGGRELGSIAGWTWRAEQAGGFRDKILISTPVPRLLACGIYSMTELLWGGVPTALWTGRYANELIP